MEKLICPLSVEMNVRTKWHLNMVKYKEKQTTLVKLLKKRLNARRISGDNEMAAALSV